ncbi:hypothetical protein [Flavobacterium hydrophilum]|uniref:Uncharacterized protein n=1 Tax=Flavobacterium hydrophilum TaxID=2211445 RepID=A0A2V4BZM0_9FLAO|nr:hypothetical protein [Flavobacterium hydrophilum]PXY44491.1 hypothetical protein DMB68_13565 [Flavobacterium hydrophilum]
MTPQQRANKIADLKQWLTDNPNHPDRTTIEADLRRYEQEQISRPIERDTLDLRDYNFYNI